MPQLPDQHPRVIAAIPCFNEERFIGSVVLKAKKYVDQVIVVDDGSTDRTAEVAEAAGALVIKHESNRGKGIAVNTAFKQARELGANAVVLLDGDGQHEPAEIPHLLQPVLNGEADIVVGSRFLDVKSKIPRYRTFGQRFLTLFTNLGSRTKLSDSQSGFRAFSGKTIEALSFREGGLSVESEMQFLIKEKSLRVSEVPISAQYQDRMKRNPVVHGLRILSSILGLTSRSLPLIFFGVPGVALLIAGIVIGLRVWDTFNTTSELALGSALFCVLLSVTGVLAIFSGVILYSIRSFLK
jgi:glycosyltransferase involved in cell wall biosynthesis